VFSIAYFCKYLFNMEFLKTLFTNQYNEHNFFLLAGPCVVENENIVMHTAEALAKICNDLKIPLVFKASYQKANRTSKSSFTGIGKLEALQILQKVKSTFGLPIVTDIHTNEDATLAAEFVDVLQIPAFLCRQTDLLVAAAQTGKVVNIKKGQFLNAESMHHAAKKVSDSGNTNIMLTERGNSFGYQDLVVDFRNILIMQQTGYPVIMDCTHAVQQPNQSSGITGGTPQYVATMAKCAIASGANGLFIETHPNPNEALSDGANMLPLSEMKSLLQKLLRIKEAVNE
jgi:2-dehydro-3-deoxyphosphooctonate aldolase (KDO 8-P synthase)